MGRRCRDQHAAEEGDEDVANGGKRKKGWVMDWTDFAKMMDYHSYRG